MGLFGKFYQTQDYLLVKPFDLISENYLTEIVGYIKICIVLMLSKDNEG